MVFSGHMREGQSETELLVRVLVFCSDGRVLIQKRSPSKNHFPGAWTESATGHIEDGETPLAAATRELTEETGFCLEVTHCGTDLLVTDNVTQLNHLFRANCTKELIPRVEVGEGDGFQWIAVDKLVEQMESHPNAFTPGIRRYILRYQTSVMIGLREAA